MAGRRRRTTTGQGTLTLRGKPVSGARIRSTTTACRARPTPDGSFSAEIDRTIAQRHPVRVSRDATRASVGGKALTAADRDAVLSAAGGIDVGYQVTGLHGHARRRRHRRWRAAIELRRRQRAPAVSLYSYRLTGRVVGPDGKPVAGAVVTTRTPTATTGRCPSRPTRRATTRRSSRPRPGQHGHPVPFAVARRAGQDLLCVPVQRQRRLRAAAQRHAGPQAGAPGEPLKNVPKPVTSRARSTRARSSAPSSRPARRSRSRPRGPTARATSARAAGRSPAGHVSLFLDTRPRFSRAVASPGHRVDGNVWATALLPGMPRRLASVRLP